MNVCHVITSVDKNSGGTSTYMKLLIESLNDSVKQNLIAFDSQQNIEIKGDIKCDFLKNKSKITFHNQEVVDAISSANPDIFHGNGLWQYPVHAMSRIAFKQNKPYVISTHGMLEPWSLSQKKLIKQLALKIFQFRDLQQAVCIHSTAPMEVENLRHLGFKNPIAMIPNGIDLQEFPKTKPVKSNAPKKILFLSRIHPKKGIENLIEAWNQIDASIRKNWIVDIVGNGETTYISSLNKTIKSLNLQDQLRIKEPVFSDNKVQAFREASLFVLPTYSENFGIVVAEALASYTPIITTKGAPWNDLETHNCGWWIDIGVEPLKKALINAMQTEENQLIIMGKNGRQLIENKYCIEAVAKQMIELYEWILHKGKQPQFINLKN